MEQDQDIRVLGDHDEEHGDCNSMRNQDIGDQEQGSCVRTVRTVRRFGDSEDEDTRHVTSYTSTSTSTSIAELPLEVLEWILCHVPPYSDLVHASYVCASWRNAANNVMRQTTNRLNKAIAEFDIRWQTLTPVDMAPSITKRFSHAACVHGNSMYVFGGCTTNSTTFNDLWRFDLSKRQWIRPLTMGAYPTPKAYTSMICYRDSLILLGGWTYSSTSQHYHDWTVFNEMHYYNITKNQWILVNTTNTPPPMAGHSAVIENDHMIVFGGLYKTSVQAQMQCSNDTWVLNLKTLVWKKQPTTYPQPLPRYGQSLIKLNSNSIMILGGVQSERNRCVCNDCWMLKMEGPRWTWHEIVIKNKEWSAMNIFCNPAIRVGDKVVSLSRPQGGSRHPITSAVRLANSDRNLPSVRARMEMNMRRTIDRDQNVNGKRGSLPHRRTNSNERKDEENENVQKPGTSSSPANGESRLKECNENVTPCSSSSSTTVYNKLTSDSKVFNLEIQSKENSVNSGNRLNRPSRYFKDNAGNKIFLNPKKMVVQMNQTNQFKMAAFSCDTPPSNPPQENELANQRRLPQLPEHQPEVPREPENNVQPPRPVKKIRRNKLAIHVLDISSILDGDPHSSVSWLCPKHREDRGAPEELVMYTLVLGKGELIMFGGVINDANLSNTSSPQYSNSLHFIKPPRDII